MKEESLKYGIKMCETIMAKFPPDRIEPNVGMFTYHHGVFLSGMERIYHITEDRKYFEYIKGWVDSVVTADGEIVPSDNPWCSLKTLDYRQAGILLFNLYRETGDERYKKVITTLTESLKSYPVNSQGGFWHFADAPNEMWLDGLYMVSPLMAMYAAEFGKTEFFDMAVNQIIVMYSNMIDEDGLLHHGWDETKQAQWADQETGLSHEVWGRACGWFVVAISDILDELPKNHDKRNEIIDILRKTIANIAKYQDKSGRWYQIINKGNLADNWLENSCTCLYLYTIAKCMHRGYLSDEYMSCLEKGFYGVINSLQEDGNGLILGEICSGIGIEDGSYAHYINWPVIQNDLHGTGAFVLMCSEIYKLLA